jgi:hypothetical protein
MQELTKQAITKLLKDTSRALRVADYEDIESLDKLADKVAQQTPEERRLLKSPFELCGIKFYPLTLAKSFWYAEKCEEWQIQGIFQDAMLFWLLTLPLTDDALDQYSDQIDAEKAAKKLSRRLHCEQDEMTAVFKKCVGAKDENGKAASDDATNYGGLIACLLREYGGTPEQWLYETPVERIGSLIEQFAARINAENEASANASSHKGKAVAPKATARLQALKSFREKVNEIRQKWSADNG